MARAPRPAAGKAGPPERPDSRSSPTRSSAAQLDAAWSRRHEVFGIHYCGADPHRYAATFARLPALAFLDVGWGGDLRTLRAHLPDTFLNIRLSPVELVTRDVARIRDDIRRLVADAGGPDLAGLCCVNMDEKVADEKITAILGTAQELRTGAWQGA